MAAVLFAIECVSKDGIVIREKASRAVVSFPISERQLGAAQICEELPNDEMVAAMATYVRRVALNWNLIE